MARLYVPEIVQEYLIVSLNIFNGFTTDCFGYIVPALRGILVILCKCLFEDLVLFWGPKGIRRLLSLTAESQLPKVSALEPLNEEQHDDKVETARLRRRGVEDSAEGDFYHFRLQPLKFKYSLGELVPFRDARIKVAKGVLSSKGVGKLIGWGSVPVSGRKMWLMNQMGLIGGDFGKKCFYQSILARFINRYQYTMKLKRYIHDPLLSQVNNRSDLQLLAPLLEALPDSLSPGLRDILKLTEEGTVWLENASNSSSLECFNGDSESNEEGQSLSNSRMNEEDDDATKELQPADPNEPGV
ncbi:uncharacterized protein HKW66_Vig0092690 [Vigna angularis]|uniref:Uncharacterized protein n=1 Tax=Phaseolus angularis TaxID=3914 RepID=A0A8T0KLI3_PHAAN|nr:uncharacterized protein HKW66_Vig0092690 [Vigna angularis]